MHEEAMRKVALSTRDLRVRIGAREILRGISLEVEHGQTLGIVASPDRKVDDRAGRDRACWMLREPRSPDRVCLWAEAGSAPVQLWVRRGACFALSMAPDWVRVSGSGDIMNPLLTLERQISESLDAHRGLTRRSARARALELLDAVGLPDPADRLNNYPHQLSGGQRQRVMIAIALACDPELLIADEPTTALDVTTQAQIIELVRQLQRDFGAAVVWVSHDLGVIGQVADSVTVLHNGEAVEQAPVLDVFDRPQHPYTRELLEASPRIDGDVAPPHEDAPVLLKVSGLDVRYSVTGPVGSTVVHAVRDLSFEIRRARRWAWWANRARENRRSRRR